MLTGSELRPIRDALQLHLPRHSYKLTPDRIRPAAVSAGQRIAGALSAHWGHAKAAIDGPIDVIDMFSGGGGMSAGFRAVNGLVPAYRLLLAVDIDPVANATYEENLGLRPLTADVSRLSRDPKKLKKLVAAAGRRPDHPLVLIGCAPCQGFSSHRNSAGGGDKRNNLFVDFARVAAALRPDAVVVENVPELLTDRYWPFVTQARRILERAGYFVHLSVHNLASFGVPQERFRALMLAFPRPFVPPVGFLERGHYRTVRDAIGAIPPVKAGGRDPDDPMHYTVAHRPSTLATIRAVPKDGGSRPPHVGPECLRRIERRQGKPGYEDVYGRLHWDRPSITLTAYARNPASGRFVHPEQHRGLSVREAALLQGFPREYWFAGTLDERFRQIGNAVPPVFASYLATHVLGEFLGARLKMAPSPGIVASVGPSFSRVIPALKAGHREEILAHAVAPLKG